MNGPWLMGGPLCGLTMQEASLPLYDKVKAEHVVPGVRALLADLHKQIDDLEVRAVVGPRGVRAALRCGQRARLAPCRAWVWRAACVRKPPAARMSTPWLILPYI